jgi:hypothetical protein
MDEKLSFLNLKGIVNRKTNSRAEKYQLGIEQEREVANLIYIQGGLNAVRIRDLYIERTNKDDLEDGDIAILENNFLSIFYDLKVAEKGEKLDKYGTITLRSICFFNLDDKHFYISVNADGSDFYIIPSKKMKEFFRDEKKCLYKSKSTERNLYIIKVTDQNKSILEKIASKYIEPNTIDNISFLDFVPSRFYKKLAINK